jgi:hypothetical protein
MTGVDALAVIATLNPIIRGWAAYYRNAVSSRAFAELDDHLWRLTYKWASHIQVNKPKHWVTAYSHPSRQDRSAPEPGMAGTEVLGCFDSVHAGHGEGRSGPRPGGSTQRPRPALAHRPPLLRRPLSGRALSAALKTSRNMRWSLAMMIRTAGMVVMTPPVAGWL